MPIYSIETFCDKIAVRSSYRCAVCHLPRKRRDLFHKVAHPVLEPADDTSKRVPGSKQHQKKKKGGGGRRARVRRAGVLSRVFDSTTGGVEREVEREVETLYTGL